MHYIDLLHSSNFAKINLSVSTGRKTLSGGKWRTQTDLPYFFAKPQKIITYITQFISRAS